MLGHDGKPLLLQFEIKLTKHVGCYRQWTSRIPWYSKTYIFILIRSFRGTCKPERMASSMEVTSDWNVVAGRNSRRMTKPAFRGNYRGKGGSKGMGFRPASKRPRVSGDSAGSSGAADIHDEVDKTLSMENFKILSLDNKLETMFSCLLDVKATNARLLKAENTVK